MNANRRFGPGRLLVVALLLVISSACIARLRVGETQTVGETVTLNDASEVDVEIRMGVGDLSIHSGAESLMDAEFVYNIDDWEPEVSYEVSGSRGHLRVEQPSTQDELGIPDDEVEYTWNIEMAQGVPLQMDVEMGAGQSRLDLQDLDVRELSVNTGAGDVQIAVSGLLEDLSLQAGAGELNLDLRGEWQENLDAQIRGGVGQITIMVPTDVGVRVSVSQGIGSVEVSGLTRDGDDYVNDAYGSSDVDLDIEVQGGIGEIIVQAGG